MPYPEEMVAPMRAELTTAGVQELRTPAEVDAFFARAFARSPGDRFQSAKELAAAFSAVARGQDGVNADTMTVAGVLAYLAWLSLGLFALLLAVILVGVASYVVPLSIAERRQQLVRQEVDTLYAHFRGLTSGTKELKLHRRRRGDFLDSLTATGDRLRRVDLKAESLLAFAGQWGQFLIFAVLGLLIFVAPRFLPLGSEARTGFILLLADVFVLFSIDLRRGGGGDREDFVLHEPESDGSGAALA